MIDHAIYAMYRGDKFIDVGTKEELLERTGLKKRTLNYYISISRETTVARKYVNGIAVIKVCQPWELEEKEEDE